jgi:hypothetical protein
MAGTPTASPAISSSSYLKPDPPTGRQDEIAQAVEDLRLSAIPMEDVERIEALVDSLIEHAQDPEALIDLLAGISLQPTTVAAIVKDYARLRRVAERHAAS